jgi:hypothetical protein
VDGTYGIVSGPDGVTIEWPQVLTSDDVLVAFVQDLRKYGISTSTQIDNTTGRMAVIANKVKAIYARGFYQEPPDMAWMAKQMAVAGDAYISLPEPKAAWIFQEEIQIHPPTVKNIAYLEFPSGKPTKSTNYAALAEELSEHIPDIQKWVTLPCSCGKKKKGSEAQIWYAIQHLNDDHHPERRFNGRRRKDIWTRERIADWLDEVDADLVFDPDLPAKRAAAREAAIAERRAMAAKLIDMSGPVTLAATSIKKDMEALGKAAETTTTGLVKINVAISEYAQQLKDQSDKWGEEPYTAALGIVNGTFANCECSTCKATQEES